MAEQIKVKAHPPGHPERFRFFTKDAFDYIKGDAIKPKWVLADEQPAPPQEKKAQAAAPAEGRKLELQAKLKELVNADIDPSWNEARLHIEIVKAQTKIKQEAEAKETEVETEEAAETVTDGVEVTEAVADKPKRKSAKKATA